MGIARISRLIIVVREQQVIMDESLASLYDVSTRILNQAVRRNPERFPEDFMFELTPGETESLRSQIVTSKRVRGGRRYPPKVFTEQGVAMLSSVLKSEAAVRVNIGIMRAFVSLRRALAAGPEASRLERVERTVDAHEVELTEHETRLNEVFAAMRRGQRRRIG